MSSAPWKVGKWAPGEYIDHPWYACDKGGHFGRGLPGASFKTWAEAMMYATTLASFLDWLVDHR